MPQLSPAKLTANQPKICYTTAGALIFHHKILLVKHKKLGFWLCSGGHIEENEMPHQAAEREFWEETGLKTVATETKPLPTGQTATYFPAPIFTNIHWVGRENFEARIASDHPDQPHCTQKWPRGCEQHLGFMYLLKLADSELTDTILDNSWPKPTKNIEETDGAGWFTLDQVRKLGTLPQIVAEVEMAFGQVG